MEKKRTLNKLSQFRCPKCGTAFLFWTWKKMSSVGYSCQGGCGYNFMIDEIEFHTVRDRKSLVLGEARKVLARKGF